MELNKEQCIEVQEKVLKNLLVEQEKCDKLEAELRELEKNPIVRKFLDIRFRWGSSNSRVSTLHKHLGMWTAMRSEKEKLEK